MKVLGIFNQKGGVGKSTIACNLSVEFAKDRKKVLLVDCDIQKSSMGWRSLRNSNDVKVISLPTYTIDKDVKDFTSFDICVIDCGVGETKIVRSAIWACDAVIVPLMPSIPDVWATIDSIESIQEAIHAKDKFIPTYFLLNMLVSHTLITKEVIRALDISPDTKLLKTTLKARVIFKTSFAKGQGVSEAEPNGKGASEVMTLHNEIKEILKQKLKENVKKPKTKSIDMDKSYKRVHIGNVDDK